MLCGTITDLMKLHSLIQLAVKAFACSAVRGMKCSIIAICAASSPDLSVTVRTSEAGVKHDLLKAFTVFPLEISYKRIISFPVRKTISFKFFCHIFPSI
jgi:hypothetical protein